MGLFLRADGAPAPTYAFDAYRRMIALESVFVDWRGRDRGESMGVKEYSPLEFRGEHARGCELEEAQGKLFLFGELRQCDLTDYVY